MQQDMLMCHPEVGRITCSGIKGKGFSANSINIRNVNCAAMGLVKRRADVIECGTGKQDWECHIEKRSEMICTSKEQKYSVSGIKIPKSSIKIPISAF